MFVFIYIFFEMTKNDLRFQPGRKDKDGHDVGRNALFKFLRQVDQQVPRHLLSES